MGIMNRRNAVIGWVTWTFFKGFLKRQAKVEQSSEEEEARRYLRWRRSQAAEPEPEPKKRSNKRVVAFLAATAVGVGIWLKARRPGGADRAAEPYGASPSEREPAASPSASPSEGEPVD